MARTTHRLTAIKIASLKGKGLYPDGNGLYLRITETGTKGWIYRYAVDGKARDMGLGPIGVMSLAKARAVADEVGWRNATHRQQWTSTLATYVYPKIGSYPVSTVDTALVLEVLQQSVQIRDGKTVPLWHGKSETASRVRGRIESVLNWAKARGYRDSVSTNPAAWRGHLDQLLAAPSKIRRVQHHPALPYGEVPAFMRRLRQRVGIGPCALEFTILTVSRVGEVLGARFEEIDINARLWTVPANRMKSGRAHRVPLSPRAIEIIREMSAVRVSEFVFPGMKREKPITDRALLMLLRGMDYGHVVTHGFRSTFRDWAAESTSFPNHVVEMALAHTVSDKVEAAYRRGDLFEKRRKLMEVWATYCGHTPISAEVVSLKRFQG
jgi:integrase